MQLIDELTQGRCLKLAVESSLLYYYKHARFISLLVTYT